MKAAGPVLLALNAGSSSLKFALYPARGELERVISGSVDGIGTANTTLTVKTPAQTVRNAEKLTVKTHVESLEPIMGEVVQAVGAASPLVAVGHRIVQGGEKWTKPQRVDSAMLAGLRGLSALDPEHLPAEIALIEAMRRRLPDLPQIACFDAAFHRDLPRVAQLLPIPRRYFAAGVRRYGYHGLSYEYMLGELRRLGDPAAERGRVILAHLGSGASLAAVRDGRCVDTTMSFTSTAGIVMSTRSGDLDPGIVDYLARTEGLTPQGFQRMVTHESGLKGLSETSADIRDLLACADRDERAADAIAVFCRSVTKAIGACAAVLGGVDTLVFAGGIGEHRPELRERMGADLAFLGITLDPGRNARNASVISSDDAPATVRVIATDEESVIARGIRRVLAPEDNSP